MNQRIEYALSSEFGPPSEPIHLEKFAQDAATMSHTLPDVQIDRESISQECSVEDIRSSVMDIWNNPTYSAYLVSSHDKAILSLHASKSSKLSKARKKATEPSKPDEQVKELQRRLDAVQLSCFKLMPQAALFTRPPRNSDYNTLTAIKTSDTAPLDADGDESNILITVAAHFKTQWRSTILNKNSQHVLLSSQTLGDLFEIIPCVSNELPEEVLEGDTVTGYKEADGTSGSSGCVIVINDLAYGDGMNEEDYADKLLQHFKITKYTKNIKKAKTAMHDTPLSSLTLRINEPYWLLHQGNCEHYVVVDEIRLKNSKDPMSGYPLTIYQAPASLDFCQACSKTPAVWSILGDVRLEASPCLLCSACWESMGESTDENVFVVPLPKYKLW